MEHKGLASRVEADLERSIVQGRCARSSLPSEREMARRYRVSRTTIRGALQGLAARGLITRHPGRKSRTVGLDQALTLESLKLALPEEGHSDPGTRRLLAGFFALKREVTVELLAACCERADEDELKQVEAACFALREEVHWREDRQGWVRQEFNLLRTAAMVADRPGHALLVQSLEKAFGGLSERVLPHLEADAIEQWALFAFGSLVERNPQALRQELPARLKAVDVTLLNHLSPVHEEPTPPTPSPAPEPSHPPTKEAASGADRPNRYACHTSSAHAPPEEGLPLQAGSSHSGSSSGCSPPTGLLAHLSPSEWQGSSCGPGKGSDLPSGASSGTTSHGSFNSPAPTLPELPCPSSAENHDRGTEDLQHVHGWKPPIPE